jgi:hypothetical protein
LEHTKGHHAYIDELLEQIKVKDEVLDNMEDTKGDDLQVFN